MSDIRETIRANLAKYISTSKYSQADIARLLKVSKPTVSNWINGVNSPNIEYLEPLCTLLDITISDIFTETPISSTFTPDERQLVEDYRSLNEQGQEYIRQTMYMAKQTYKKMPDFSDVEKQA